MISQKTVLVLGAGASMPYGYPSGKALRDDVASGRFDAAISEYFHQVSHESIEQFSQSFLFSQLHSIDEFLSRRGHEHIEAGSDVTFEQVGKAAISLALRENRKLDYLMHDPLLTEDQRKKLDFNDHWYQYLWKRLSDDIDHTSPSKIAENEITIVTFNYDLSLEFYLLEACCATFGIHKTEAAAILANIEVVHLYGSLSGNPFGKVHGEVPDYSKHLDRNQKSRQLHSDINSLKVMYESREQTDAEFGSACQALLESDVICFLGFGFDPVNVRRLRISDTLAQRYKHYKPGAGASTLPNLYATLPWHTNHQRLRIVNSVWNTNVSSSINHDYYIPFNHKNSTIERWRQESDFKSLALLNETGAF